MSLLPLYKRDTGEPKRLPPDGHRGLWFDKFCNVWQRNGVSSWALSAPNRQNRDDEAARESPKFTWIETVTGTPVGDPKQLEEYWRRMLRLVQSRQGCFWVMRADSRFVTGLGRRHPIENGFVWHPTLGTPYLPGSSIKGMIRAWGQAEGKDVDKILGSPGKVGRVALLDALPTAPVKLEPDVMTPHYAGWTRNDPPGDWHSPKPIPFLTAAANTTLLFAAVPAAGADSTGDITSDFRKVETWLSEALTWHGAGAKTAVGYGRFSCDHHEIAQLAEELKKEGQKKAEQHRREELSATREGRCQLELETLTEQKVLDKAKSLFEGNESVDQADRVAFARVVSRMGYLDRWLDGRSDSPLNEKKLKKRARLIREELERAPGQAEDSNTD